MNLLIHFAPGARGDFLASILLGSIESNSIGQAVGSLPPEIKRIHHLDFFTIPTDSKFICSVEEIKNFAGIKIRIDPENDGNSLVSIAANHLLKNKVESKPLPGTDAWYEYIYYFSLRYLLLESSQIAVNKSIYTYWISFKDLYDINFIHEFYCTVTGNAMSNDLSKQVIDNLNLQFDFNADQKLIGLGKLLDFEIQKKLLNKKKNYRYLENLDSIDNYLNLFYYNDI